MNLRFVKSAGVALMMSVLVVSCGSNEDAPLLKGHISGLGEKSEAYLIYSFEGDVQSNVYDKIELDSLGNFEFSPTAPEGFDFMEVLLSIDGATYGAYVEKGATTEMNVEIVDSQEYATVTFAGDNADLSNAVNVAAQAYDFMRYFSMEPEDSKTYEEYRTLLDSENNRVTKALEEIKDAGKKEYYAKLFDLQYISEKMRILGGKLYDDGYTADSMICNDEYRAMYDRIDIADPMMVKANLTAVWVDGNQPYSMNWEKPDVDSLIMNLTFIDENIKEPVNRRAAFHSAPFFFLEKCKPSKADAAKYMATFSSIAADYPDIVEHYQKVADGIVELKEGAKMPYYPVLTGTDGKEVKLTDLLGKVTYIDIWATWCGPCCREIPYLDEVVKRFKGKDGIQFISISVDDDRQAWLDKLAKDNPEWPQYQLVGDEKNTFMTSMGIQGIPRFILLDVEGRFIQSDAVRPSSDNIDAVLDEALK